MSKEDNPGIIIPPPVYVIAVVAMAYVADHYWSLTFPATTTGFWGGVIVGVFACVLLVACAWEFYRHKTDIRPHKPASCMICSGPYRIGRNPIYLSFLLMQLSLGLIEHHGWVLVSLPVSYVILRYYVIANEEAYLQRKFGDEYLGFCRSVRRWI